MNTHTHTYTHASSSKAVEHSRGCCCRATHLRSSRSPFFWRFHPCISTTAPSPSPPPQGEEKKEKKKQKKNRNDTQQ